MMNLFKTASLSALAGAALMAATTAGVRADDLYFGLDSGRDTRGVLVQDDDDNDGWRRDGRRNWRDRQEDHRGWRACSPDRALDKAERLGIRRARIVDVDRRTIEVAGRKYGQRVHVIFARAPHCPVIS